MQAVIVTGGKQYSVKEGDVIYVEKLNAEADATVTFDQVLAVVDGENSKFGAAVKGIFRPWWQALLSKHRC